MTLYPKTVAALTLAATAFSGLAAQESATGESAQSGGLLSAEKLNLKEISCWDIVTMPEADRGNTLILLYGFARGEKGEAAFSPRDVQTASVNTIQECLDKPNAKALGVLKSHIF